MTNYGEFRSLTVLGREFRKYFKLSARQLPHSYFFSWVINECMASAGVSPSKPLGPLRTKIIEKNIDTVKNLVEENPNSSISLPTSTSICLPELVNTVERYVASLNKNKIITSVNDILPRAQACI